RGRIAPSEADLPSLRFRTGPGPMPSKLEWSSDGRLLLAVSPRGLRLYDAHRRLVRRARALRSKLDAPREGRLLLAVPPRALRVYDANGRLVSRDDASDARLYVDATFLPG